MFRKKQILLYNISYYSLFCISNLELSKLSGYFTSFKIHRLSQFTTINIHCQNSKLSQDVQQLRVKEFLYIPSTYSNFQVHFLPILKTSFGHNF